MKLHPDSRTRLLIDVILDVDPTDTTVELAVDDTWYPAAWRGTPDQRDGRWRQTARTTGYFAGPTAASAGAVVLAAGRHLTKMRVVAGADTLANQSSPIDVTP